jgi:hypothetical protein
MSIKLCENVPPVTIFGNFCVIWGLLRKVQIFLTEVERVAEFIVTSRRTQPRTAAPDGLPLVNQIPGNRRVKIKKRRAMGGVGRSERSGQAKNKLVCFQKRLRAAMFITFFLCFVDRAYRYSYVIKTQLDALFILNLFRHSSSTCFGHICRPSSGGILYIYNNWYVLCFFS